LDRHPGPFYFLPRERCWQCCIICDMQWLLLVELSM
jgi:hypothetical protein